MKKIPTFVLVFFGLMSAKGQVVSGSGSTLIGQDSTNKVVTTAVPFLNITPDSRAAGMGDTGVATEADANSSYWNTAKLVFIEDDYGASLSYTPWLAKIVSDIYIFYLTGFYKINKQSVVATSMRYFTLGSIDFNDGPNPNDQLGSFTPREFSFDVTYSRLLTKSFSIGGALRYIHSNLTGKFSGQGNDARPANTAAVDLGIYYTKPLGQNNSKLALGLAVSNIGGKITYSDAANKDFLPANLRFGGAYTFELDPLNKFNFALDFNKLLVPSPGPDRRSKAMLAGVFQSFSDAKGGFGEELKEITASFGVEYWYNKLVSGRFGYFLEAKEKGNRKYFTLGLGIRYINLGLDVAYLIPSNKRENALAETLRVSLMFQLKKKVKAEN